MDIEKILLPQMKELEILEDLEKCKKAVEIIENFIKENPKNIQIFYDTGGISVLIKALRLGDFDLCFLVKDPKLFIIQKNAQDIPKLVEAGFLEVLVEFFNSGNKQKLLLAMLLTVLTSMCNSAVLRKPEILLCLVKVLNAKILFALSTDACEALTYIGNGESEDENYNIDGKNAVIQAGAVPILVKHLNGKNKEMLVLSIKAIGQLATGNSAQKQSIINANGIPILVKLMSSQNHEICFHATWSIYHISRGTVTQRNVIVKAGAIPPLLHLATVSSKTDMFWITLLIEIADKEVCLLANMALLFLTFLENAIQEIVNHGGIEDIIKFLASSDEDIAKVIFAILKNIVLSSTKNLQICVEAGIIPEMVKFSKSLSKKHEWHEDILKVFFQISRLSAKSIIKNQEAIVYLNECLKSTNEKIGATAAIILANIVYKPGEFEARQVLIQAKTIPALFGLFKSSDLEYCNIALDLIYHIANGLPYHRKAVIFAGTLPKICKFCDLNNVKIFEQVTKVFCAVIRGASPNERCAMKCLVKQLESDNYKIQKLAIHCITKIVESTESPGGINLKSAIFPLLKLLTSSHKKVVRLATNAICKIIGRKNLNKQISFDVVILILTDMMKSCETDESLEAVLIILHSTAIASSSSEQQRKAIIESGILQQIIKYYSNFNNAEIFLNIVKILCVFVKESSPDEKEAIEFLINHLENKNETIQKYAAAGIKHIAIISIDKLAIIDLKVLFLLVKLLESPNIEVVFQASEAICHIIAGTNIYANILVETNIICAFLQLLEKYSSNDHMCVHGIGGLRNIAFNKNHEMKDLIAKENILSRIVGFLTHSNPEVLVQAAGTFVNLASGSKENCQAVFDVGAVPHLIKLLDNTNVNVCKEALLFFNNIAEMGTKEQILEANNSEVVGKIKSLIESPDEEIVKYATVIYNRILAKIDLF